MTIPVKSDPEMLPPEIRKLCVMRYIQRVLPASSRWHPIFVRYIDQIAARVRELGGDPDQVEPSPDGGETEVPICPTPRHHHKKADPSDFLDLNIPWNELRRRRRAQPDCPLLAIGLDTVQHQPWLPECGM